MILFSLVGQTWAEGEGSLMLGLHRHPLLCCPSIGQCCPSDRFQDNTSLLLMTRQSHVIPLLLTSQLIEESKAGRHNVPGGTLKKRAVD